MKLPDWVKLRHLLWNDRPADYLLAEADAILASPNTTIALLAQVHDETVGFTEATIRSDYVNGCSTSPVAFLEAIFVQPTWRRYGIARTLCAKVEAWAAARGIKEFASDAELDNVASHRFHEALGFKQTEKVVYFLKTLNE